MRRLEQDRATLADPDRVARALGVLYARNQDVPRAEEEFKKAVTSKPDSPEAHLALARLHLGKRELPEAEKEFKAAADLAPAGSFARLQLADFYLLTRRVDDAVKVLTQITTEAPDAFPAWLRRAEIAFAQGKLDEAQTAVDAVLGKSADNASALIIQTRLHLAKREPAKAVESAQKAVKAQPSNGLAYYTLALAQAASGNNALALSRGEGRRGALADARRTRSSCSRSCSCRRATPSVRSRASRPTSRSSPRTRAPGRRSARRSCARAMPPGRATSFAQDGRARSREPAGALSRGPRTARAGASRPRRSSSSRRRSRWRRGSRSRSSSSPRMSFVEKNPQAAIARIERQALLEPKSRGDPVPAGSRLPGERRHEAGREGVPEGDRAQPAGGRRRT